MNILLFIFLIIVYICVCYFAVRVIWWSRSRITATVVSGVKRVVIEWSVSLIFLILFIPFGVFFPAWLSESMEVVERTRNITAGLILFGSAVLAASAFLGQRKSIER